MAEKVIRTKTPFDELRMVSTVAAASGPIHRAARIEFRHVIKSLLPCSCGVRTISVL